MRNLSPITEVKAQMTCEDHWLLNPFTRSGSKTCLFLKILISNLRINDHRLSIRHVVLE